MEKRTPHRKLSLVKDLVKANKVRATVSAFNGASELGRAKPPLALVKLLWVLDRHPNLLKELKSIDDFGIGTSAWAVGSLSR